MLAEGMRIALALALLSAAPAFAGPPEPGVPEVGEGTVSVLGGLRLIPFNGGACTGGCTHRLLEPGALASFGYQYDEELHFKIDLGYGIDKDTDKTVRSVQLLIGLDTALMKRSWFTIYGGGGIGYSLNTFTAEGKDNVEANATAAFLQLGWRVRLTTSLALILEERYTLASALGQSVGGNLIAVGLMFHFNQPDDKGHPQAP